MKVLNGTKVILDDQGNHINSLRISLESFMSFRGLLFHKLATGQILFLATRYKNPAQVIDNNLAGHYVWQWLIIKARLYFNPMLAENKDVKLGSRIYLEFYRKSYLFKSCARINTATCFIEWLKSLITCPFFPPLCTPLQFRETYSHWGLRETVQFLCV